MKEIFIQASGNRALRLALGIITAFLPFISAFAQTNGSLGLTWYSFDSGGGALGNGPMVMTVTIGQPDAQVLSSGGLMIEGGFQAAERQGPFRFVFGDSFAERGPLAGLPASIAGFNAGMSKEPDEPNHAGDIGGRSVWWTWIAPSNALVTVDTLGSSFDTLLAVYTGDTVSNLLLVASNDNIEPSTSQSSVTFSAVAGVAYQISVDGHNGAEGSIVLSLRPPMALICPADITVATFANVPLPDPQGVTALFACEPVTKSFISDTRLPKNCQTEILRTYRVVDGCGRTNTCNQRITVNRPINDSYAGSFLTGLPISTNGCNVNATWESGEFQDGPAEGHLVWWFWLAPKTTTVVVDTIGSSFDTWLGISQGGIGNIIELDDNSGENGASRIKFTVFAGNYYGIMVDGRSGATGNIKLNISECPPPIINVTTSQSVQPDGIHILFCADVQGTPPFTYNWTVTNGNWTARFDLGSCFEVVVDPTDEAGVGVSLSVSDACGGANNGSTATACGICLSRGAPSLLAGTTGSSVGPQLSTLNCGTLSAGTRWFKMIATNETGLVTVSTEGSANDTLLAVFTGTLTDPVQMVHVACSDDVSASNHQSRVTFNAVRGTVYWIAVDPRANATGLKLVTGFEPRIESYGFTPGRVFEVKSTIAPAISYTLEMTTNPTPSSSWTEIQTTNATTAYPYLHFRDTNAVNSARRFYRMKSSP